MGAGLEIASSERKGCCVLTVTGALDMLYARRLEVALIQHTSVEMPLVLDLGDLDFMDSSGLYVVLRTAHQFHRIGQKFVLVPSRAVMTLLEVAGVEQVLAICPSVEDALAMLGATANQAEAAPASEP